MRCFGSSGAECPDRGRMRGWGWGSFLQCAHMHVLLSKRAFLLQNGIVTCSRVSLVLRLGCALSALVLRLGCVDWPGCSSVLPFTTAMHNHKCYLKGDRGAQHCRGWAGCGAERASAPPCHAWRGPALRSGPRRRGRCQAPAGSGRGAAAPSPVAGTHGPAARLQSAGARCKARQLLGFGLLVHWPAAREQMKGMRVWKCRARAQTPDAQVAKDWSRRQ